MTHNVNGRPKRCTEVFRSSFQYRVIGLLCQHRSEFSFDPDEIRSTNINHATGNPPALGVSEIGLFDDLSHVLQIDAECRGELQHAAFNKIRRRNTFEDRSELCKLTSAKRPVLIPCADFPKFIHWVVHLIREFARHLGYVQHRSSDARQTVFCRARCPALLVRCDPDSANDCCDRPDRLNPSGKGGALDRIGFETNPEVDGVETCAEDQCNNEQILEGRFHGVTRMSQGILA